MSGDGGSLALCLERAGNGDLAPGGFSHESTFLHMLMLPVFQIWVWIYERISTWPQDVEVKVQLQVSFSCHQYFLRIDATAQQGLGAGCWSFST